MIDHIYVALEQVFKQTKYENIFFVYNDALSILWGEDAQRYVKQRGLRLVAPQLGLNAASKYYATKPVGNLPLIMPLDAHGHEYLHDSVDRHVVKTKHLPVDDPHKFSKRTPRLINDAYQ